MTLLGRTSVLTCINRCPNTGSPGPPRKRRPWQQETQTSVMCWWNPSLTLYFKLLH